MSRCLSLVLCCGYSFLTTGCQNTIYTVTRCRVIMLSFRNGVRPWLENKQTFKKTPLKRRYCPYIWLHLKFSFDVYNFLYVLMQNGVIEGWLHASVCVCVTECVFGCLRVCRGLPVILNTYIPFRQLTVHYSGLYHYVHRTDCLLYSNSNFHSVTTCVGVVIKGMCLVKVAIARPHPKQCSLQSELSLSWPTLCDQSVQKFQGFFVFL